MKFKNKQRNCPTGITWQDLSSLSLCAPYLLMPPTSIKLFPIAAVWQAHEMAIALPDILSASN